MNHVPQANFRFLMAFALLAAFVACTSSDKDKTIHEEKIIEKGIDTAEFGGKLDTLYIESSTFTSLPKGPLVFSFAFRGKDALTLYGWIDKKGQGKKQPDFNNSPDIKLLKAKASTLSYGPNVIFGNLVITKQEVEKIEKALADLKAKYVLFAPKKVGDSIAYDIYVTKDDPMALVKIAPDPTGVEANPTPPKPWDD